MAKQNDVVCVSGGADPIHVGHIRMIEEASEYGDVIWILNSDEWLKRKKGYSFMKWEHRAEVLRAIAGVNMVVPVDDSDGTVCEALKRIKPTYFANGGDRTIDSTPEIHLCRELGIKMLFNVGGEKISSSSELVKAANV
jgi:cytidyltransferase-like protein